MQFSDSSLQTLKFPTEEICAFKISYLPLNSPKLCRLLAANFLLSDDNFPTIKFFPTTGGSSYHGATGYCAPSSAQRVDAHLS